MLMNVLNLFLLLLVLVAREVGYKSYVPLIYLISYYTLLVVITIKFSSSTIETEASNSRVDTDG